jgi:two-component system NtrC family sensor kinase
LIAYHHSVVRSEDKYAQLATQIANELNGDINQYIEHEEKSPYPEGQEEIRLMIRLREHLQNLRTSATEIMKMHDSGLPQPESMSHWDEMLDRHVYEIQLLVREINRLHFDIIARKVEKSRQFKSVILTLYVLFSVVGLALVYLGYRLNSRNIVGPLKNLADATSKIAEGDLSIRVATHSQTEIGALYSTFNSMLDRLQSHEEFLVEFNQHLERRVEERTRELEQTHQSLSTAQSELLRIEKMAMLGQIATSVNHEIRTPLNALYMNMQLLQKSFDKCDGFCSHAQEDVITRVALVNQEVLRITDILDEFVRYARFAPPQLLDIDLSNVVKYVAEMIEERAVQSGVTLSLHLSERSPLVQADENKLVQALLNLCINAIHAMPNGGSLNLATTLRENHVEISVADTGIGIAEEDIGKIFLPFFTKKESGLGFGLPIVQRIVEDHGGKITCQSRLGEGTVFVIQLPVQQSKHVGDGHEHIAADR